MATKRTARVSSSGPRPGGDEQRVHEPPAGGLGDPGGQGLGYLAGLDGVALPAEAQKVEGGRARQGLRRACDLVPLGARAGAAYSLSARG